MKTNLSSVEVRPRANRAFTLIELLIVVAIIGILTAAVMVNFSSAKSKSRDGKRVSDLGNIQLALTQYFDRCREYPSPINTGLATFDLSADCPNISTQTVTFGDYIGTIPVDPINNSTYKYEYAVNTAKNAFLLRTTLENSSSVLTDSFDNTAASRLGNQFFVDVEDPLPPIFDSFTLGSYECPDVNIAPKLYIYCLSSKF